MPIGEDLSAAKEPLSMLLYGLEGAGKTTAALRLSKLGKILVINSEAGAKRRPLAAQGVVLDNVETWPKGGDIDHITFESIEQEVYIPLRMALEEDPNAYIGVVVDSFTELSHRLVEKAAAAGRVKSRIKTPNKDVNEFAIELDDWGIMTTQMRIIFRRFRDLGLHLIITALERRDVDKATSVVTYGPAVGPALANDTMGMVDIVVWTQLEELGAKAQEFYTGTTRARERHRAKDRFGVLPVRMIEPTADRVLAYLDGTMTKATDPRHQAAAKAAQSG